MNHKDGEVVLERGKIPKKALKAFWSSVNVRWGFRKKSNNSNIEPKIYWTQKNKNYSDPQDGTKYLIEAPEDTKDKFVPQDLPMALLLAKESDLEVVAEVLVGQFEKLASVNLPANFKTELMQVTNILVVPQLSPSTATDDSITMNWGRVTNAVGYIIYHSSTSNFVIDGNTSKVIVNGGNTLTGTITGLTSGSRYYYKVVAKAAVNRNYLDSYASSEGSESTTVSAPRCLSLSKFMGAGQNRASWAAPVRTNKIVGYTISWGATAAADSYRTKVNIGITSYTISSNMPVVDQKLYVKIKSRGSNGLEDSGWIGSSNTLTVTTKMKLPAPLRLVLSPIVDSISNTGIKGRLVRSCGIQASE